MEEKQTYNYYEIKLKNEEILELWAKNLIYRYEYNALIIVEGVMPQIEYINLNKVMYVNKIHTGINKEEIYKIIRDKMLAETYSYR